jgi:hypothetical protein
MARLLAVAFLSLLLVGMQREALLHEVDHLRAKVAVGHDKVLQKSAGGECVECALLASGSSVAPPAPAAFLLAAHDDTRFAVDAADPPAVARPAPYQSRAPPIVL